MVVVSDDDEGFSTGSGSIKDDYTTEYESDNQENVEEELDSACDEKQEKPIYIQENFIEDNVVNAQSVKKVSTSSMHNNLRSRDNERKVSTLSAVEIYSNPQNSTPPKRKLSFYLDFDPTATPPPTPRTPKQSETNKLNFPE